jgi:hypothetical protein
MGSFNELEKSVNLDFDDTAHMESLQKLKQVILTRLKSGLIYINTREFYIACITCSAARILGLLKYKISKDFLSEEEQVEAIGEAITDYKLDKKYTDRFYEIINSLKEHISKFLSSKNLRKQFQINSQCLQHIKKEKSAIDQTLPTETEVKLPEWLETMTEEELNIFAEKVIELLNNNQFDEFKKFIDHNNYY